MAKLPRYERLGVRAAAPAQLDMANLREFQNAASSIGSSLGRMADFERRKEEQKARLDARQMVEDTGAVPLLQRIDEAGGPRTQFDYWAMESANTVAVAEIQIEADQEINRLTDEAKRTGMSVQAYQAAMSDIADGFGATLSYLDPEAAGVLRTRIEGSGQNAVRVYGNYVAERARVARNNRLNEAAGSYAEDVAALAITPGVTLAEVQAALNSHAQTLRDSGMEEAKVETFIRDAGRNAVREHTVFTSMNMPLDELRTASETVPTAPLPGFDYEETITLWKSQGTAYNIRTESLRTEATAVSSDISTQRMILANGGTPSASTMADLRGRADNLMAFNPRISAELNRLEADADYVTSVRGMNLTELQAEVSRVSGGVVGIGDLGLDTVEELTMRDIATQALTVAERAQAEAEKLQLDLEQEAARPQVDRISAATELLSLEIGSGNANPNTIEVAITEIEDAYSQIPESQRTEAMNDEVQALRQIADDMTSWKSMLPAEQKAALDDLKTGSPSDLDVTGSGITPIEQELINRRRASILGGIMEAQQEAFANGDLLSFASTQNILFAGSDGQATTVGAPLDLSTPEALRSSFDRRRLELGLVQERYSVKDQNMLLPQERAMLGGMITGGDIGTATAAMAMIVDMGQEEALKIFSELGLDDPVVGHIGGLMYEGNEQAALTAMRGMRAEAPPAVGGNTAKVVVNNTFEGSLSEVPAYANGVYETANAIYADMASRGVADFEALDEDRYAEAINMALGDMTIDSIGGRETIIPKTVDAGAVSDWIDEPRNIPNLISPTENPGEIPYDALDGLDWTPVPVGQNQYVLRHTSGASFQDWADTNGNRIILDLRAFEGIK